MQTVTCTDALECDFQNTYQLLALDYLVLHINLPHVHPLGFLCWGHGQL